MSAVTDMDRAQNMHKTKTIWAFLIMAASVAGPAAAADRIRISSDWGSVTATLAENDAARALAKMLPVTISMRDHLRQEKTGDLPSPLPEIRRQVDFGIGTLGLWSSDHFVIYYRAGRVPQPGIILLGKVDGDVAIFDRPGSVVVRIERLD